MCTGNDTRGIWFGGSTPSVTNVMDYITIATTGNAADFGDLRLATFGGTNGTVSNGHGGLS